jgi:ribosome-interacting GTPase 1
VHYITYKDAILPSAICVCIIHAAYKQKIRDILTDLFIHDTDVIAKNKVSCEALIDVMTHMGAYAYFI